MKILFLSDNFPPETNAAASRVFERALHWVREGHEVTFLTSAPNKPHGKVYPGYTNAWRTVEMRDGMRVVRVKTFVAANEGAVLRILDFLSYMLSAFVFGLFERRPDVLVATSPQFFTGVSGWALAKVKRVPFVFEIADLWPAGIAAVGAIRQGFVIGMLEKLELFLYRQAMCVVSLTEAFRDDLVRRGIAAGKIRVVKNGVEQGAFFPKSPDPALQRDLGLEDKFVVGYLGTMGAAHGLESAIHAAKILEEKAPRVQFLFVGAGSEEEKLKALARELGLRNVTFTGNRPKQEMVRHWSVCDLALVSLRAGDVLRTVIPSKIFEAMACGKAVVLAGPEGEATEIIRSTGCGEVVPPGDSEALAQVLAELSSDRTRMLRLAQTSLQAAKLFSREKQAELMLDALKASGL